MRGVPAIVALLLTALVVGLLVRQQLRPTAARPAAGQPPGVSAPPSSDPLRAEQQVRDGLAAAEAEAKRRNDAAERQAN